MESSRQIAFAVAHVPKELYAPCGADQRNAAPDQHDPGGEDYRPRQMKWPVNLPADRERTNNGLTRGARKLGCDEAICRDGSSSGAEVAAFGWLRSERVSGDVEDCTVARRPGKGETPISTEMKAASLSIRACCPKI